MPERQRHREIPTEHRAAEHLANERTFLAWVRTNIAFISLGFVLARLGPWLRESGINAPRLATKAWPLGIGLVGFGALLTLLAASRYDAVNREIETGLVKN
jgi:putative membrane protein